MNNSAKQKKGFTTYFQDVAKIFCYMIARKEFLPLCDWLSTANVMLTRT